MQIIDGKKLSKEILSQVKKEVKSLNFQPLFCDILVGEDPSSIQYVQMKARTAESIGIKFHNAYFSRSITTKELIEEIKVLNQVKNMCGIIIQLPLPQSIDKRAVLDAIHPSLDVDCLGTVAGAQFYEGYSGSTQSGFPAALACLAILDTLNLNLANKNIVVLGQGDLVGKPVSALLSFRGLNPTVINSTTPDKEELIKKADVIISGMGRGKYITGEMIKKGVIIIDAGTSESNGGIVGDVDLDSIKDVAGYVSPVPGGVGPVTVAILLNNVLTVAKNLK